MRIIVFSRSMISNFSVDLIRYLMKRNLPVEGVVIETSFRKKYSHNEMVYRENRKQFKWKTGVYSLPHYLLVCCWDIIPLRIKELISRNIFHVPVLRKESIEYKCRGMGVPIYKVKKHSSQETVG